jgi:type I restriction enzyme S subunit
VLYATRPIGRIVGYFGVTRILKDTPENLWERCKDGAGLSELAFLQYYKTSKNGYALEVGETRLLSPSIDPRTLFPDWTAPQSFMYISPIIAKKLLEEKKHE